MKNRIIAILACILCSVFTSNVSALDITSKSAIVMDAENDKIFYELNADIPLAPASMTKIMTIYIVYEKINEGILTKDTVIIADKEDEIDSQNYVNTNVPLIAGEGYTVDELIAATLIPSACAASELLGKHISGSKADFANLMNTYVGILGLEAYYDDACGVSNNNRISARSMAKLAKILIEKYPDVLNYTSMTTLQFRGNAYKNTNRMLPGRPNEYPGTDGLKTGTTTLAGCCFTGTNVRNGNRLISVTMDSDSGSKRFTDTIALMEYGFSQIDYYYNNIFCTDMRLLLDGHEVPAFASRGKQDGLCLIIEDLQSYGFDVTWDNDTRTVKAVFNPDKAITPIPMDYYRSLQENSVFMPIIAADIAAEIVYNNNTYRFNHVYPLNGYTAVSADELGGISSNITWNSADKTLSVELN